MEFIEKLYVGESVDSGSLKKWKHRIGNHRNVLGILLVVVRTHNHNLMEIVSTQELKRLYKREKDIWIIGIAQGRQEAFKLVAQICQNLVEKDLPITKTNLMKELAGCDS